MSVWTKKDKKKKRDEDWAEEGEETKKKHLVILHFAANRNFVHIYLLKLFNINNEKRKFHHQNLNFDNA